MGWLLSHASLGLRSQFPSLLGGLIRSWWPWLLSTFRTKSRAIVKSPITRLAPYCFIRHQFGRRARRFAVSARLWVRKTRLCHTRCRRYLKSALSGRSEDIIMLVVLSPAKTLDLSAIDDSLPISVPSMQADVQELLPLLCKQSVADLKRMFAVSEAVAKWASPWKPFIVDVLSVDSLWFELLLSSRLSKVRTFKNTFIP